VADTSIGGRRAARELDAIVAWRREPATIVSDNGPEFVSRALDRWAYENGVTLDFSRPGEPTDNAFVESFNGRLRDECLNTRWFLSLADASQGQDRGVATALQREPCSHIPGLDDARRICLSAGVNLGR
jgi:putative transposase